MTESTYDATLREMYLHRIEPASLADQAQAHASQYRAGVAGYVEPSPTEPQRPRAIEDIAAAIYPNLVNNRDRKDQRK